MTDRQAKGQFIYWLPFMKYKDLAIYLICQVKREGYTNFLAFIIISCRIIYQVHTLPPPILYKSDKNQSIRQLTFSSTVYKV